MNARIEPHKKIRQNKKVTRKIKVLCHAMVGDFEEIL